MTAYRPTISGRWRILDCGYANTSLPDETTVPLIVFYNPSFEGTAKENEKLNVMANSIVFTAEHYHTKESREIHWLTVSVIIVIHSSDLIWINGLPYRMSSIRITEKESKGK